MPSSDVKKLMTCPNPKLTDLANHDVEKRQSMSRKETLETHLSEEARKIAILQGTDLVGRTGRTDCGTLTTPGFSGVEDRGNLERRVDLGLRLDLG